MILTILMVLILIFIIGFPTLLYIKDRETMAFVICFAIIPLAFIYTITITSAYGSPDKRTSNGLTYEELSYLAEHYDELSVDKKIEVSHNVKDWNESLDSSNNYWTRFTLADYSSYVITIENEIEIEIEL